MTTLWKDVRCASIPVEELPLLADLRGRSEIRVFFAGTMAWMCWEPDSESMQSVVLRRILPLPGVELFTDRGGRWYRLGEHLPAFGVPIGDGSAGITLDQIILPAPIHAQRPEGIPPVPVSVRLVRDERGLVRAASALRCPLSVFGAWAERATSAQFEHLHGVWSDGRGGVEDDALMLVLGTPGAMPFFAEGVRFWGTDLLIPLGFRADPDLPEPALRRVVGAGAGDLTVLDHDGFELIARGHFKPLSRASVRLAWEVRKGAGPVEGSPR